MKHKKVVKRLTDRQKAYDGMTPTQQAACTRPGSMSGRK